MNFWYSATLGDMSCLKQVEFYINKAERETGKALGEGLRCHKEVENYFNARINSEGEVQPVGICGIPAVPDSLWEYIKDLLPLASVQANSDWLREGFPTEIWATDFPTSRIKQTGIETKLAAKEDDVRVKGILDFITDDHKLLDWKFPQNPWDQYKADKYLQGQGVIYPWLCKMNGIELTDAEFVVCPPKGDLQIFKIPLDWDLIEKGMRYHKMRYRKYVNAANNDGFYPSPSTWSCRWCNYKAICSSAQA